MSFESTIATDHVARFAEPLSRPQIVVLRQCCGPIDFMPTPSADIVHSLMRLGLIRMSFGTLRVTSRGLERLLQDRGHD